MNVSPIVHRNQPTSKNIRIFRRAKEAERLKAPTSFASLRSLPQALELQVLSLSKGLPRGAWQSSSSILNSKLPSAMPFRAAPVSSKLASARSAFTIQYSTPVTAITFGNQYTRGAGIYRGLEEGGTTLAKSLSGVQGKSANVQTCGHPGVHQGDTCNLHSHNTFQHHQRRQGTSREAAGVQQRYIWGTLTTQIH